MKEKFEKIIDNPLFFKWIFNPDEATQSYWKEYMKNHPDEVQFILRTKSDLKQLNPQNNILTSGDKDQLSSKILRSLEKEDKKVRRLNTIKVFMRYAAVAILFSCISGLMVYFQMNQKVSDTYDRYVMAPMQVSEPTLILSENDKISLQKSESTVNYSKTGEIVLNNERVIKSVNRTVQKPRINQLVIPFGSSSKISLSDGTLVWLNSGSRLVYPSTFSGKLREVTLYGEAYFDVYHDEDMPFIVKTSALDIKVLGTEFNVSAYPDDKIIQTVLKEGSVAIRKKGATLFDRDLILKPNQLNVFNKETEYSTVYNVNANDYTIWVDGLLKFEDENLSRVIKKVERFYNIWISYEKPELGKIKITGKLDLHQSGDEVLEYLSKVSRNKYVKIGENKYLLK